MSERKTKLVSAINVVPGDMLCLAGGGVGTVVQNETRGDYVVRLHYMVGGRGFHFDLSPEQGIVHFPLVEILDLSA